MGVGELALLNKTIEVLWHKCMKAKDYLEQGSKS